MHTQYPMRFALLALLAGAPAHGYELKRRFEQRFDGVLPPVNIGQIYTTLGRAERDGLVEAERVDGDGRDKRVYRLTDEGHDALRAWLSEPAQQAKLRDEFFMKLVLAAEGGLAAPGALIATQRAASLQALRDLDRLSAQANGGIAGSLLVEGAALHLEADLKWLALCEERLKERHP